MIFITIGGLADVASDIILLCRMLYFYFTNGKHGLDDIDETTEQTIFSLRIYITFCAGLAVVILLFLVMTLWPVLKAQLTGKPRKKESSKMPNDPFCMLLLMVC
jgi:hypothetical protein